MDERPGWPDEPEGEVFYRLYWQPVADGQSRPAGPWRETGHDFADRATAEATAERFCLVHNKKWPDLRNYAVVEISSRTVKLYLAPMGAG
jgi:hypothetical protein